jgi:hypothetical protein
MALGVQGLTQTEQVPEADDVLGFEVGGRHSKKGGGATHVCLGQVNEASDFAALRAAGLTLKPKTFHDVPSVLAKLYNPNREKYIRGSELREDFSARI